MEAASPGASVIVRDDDGRKMFLEILDRMDKAGPIKTDGLRKLHEVARLPIISGTMVTVLMAAF
jgi:hypothetical protein